MIARPPYFPNLEAEITKSGISKKSIADKLNISSASLSNKLTGKYEFNLSEVFELQRMFPQTTFNELFETAS